MTKQTKNRIITVAALLLIAIAAFLTLQLIIGDDSIFGSDEEPTEEPTTQPTTVYQGLVPIVQSKYLWQYGWQQIANERPSEMPDDDKDEDKEPTEEVTTVYEPVTYYEPVTNWKGEIVTDENGNEVTEVRTMPRTEVFSEVVTDENGEAVTDAEGNVVTEVHTQVVTTTQPPVAVTDENGEAITDEAGNIVTEATTVEKTTAFVGNTAAPGSKQWAQGVTDGENYVRMKIYIDGEYDITSRSVMTMTVREKSGLVSIPDTLTYNLSSGVCTVSPTKKYEQMAYVTKSGGQTIVTLIIPEDSCPSVSNTTTFRASSTYSTFTDANGARLGEFTVSVF